MSAVCGRDRRARPPGETAWLNPSKLLVGGATNRLPPGMADRMRYLPKSPAEHRKRLSNCPMPQSSNDSAWKAMAVQPANRTRRQLSVGIASAIESRPPAFRRSEELIVAQVARNFGVSPAVVYYWIGRVHLHALRVNAGSRIGLHSTKPANRSFRPWYETQTEFTAHT